MAVTPPTGPLWTSYLLEITLADVPEWRTLVGAATREDAQEYIYYPWVLNPELNQAPTGTGPNHGLPPRAIISDDADVAPYRRYQKSLGSFIGEDNSLQLSFDIPIPEATYDQGPKAAGYWFSDTVGNIMRGLQDLAGKGTAIPAGVIGDIGYSYLNMQSYSKLDGPFELDPAEYTMEWLRNSNIPRYVYHMSFTLEHR